MNVVPEYIQRVAGGIPNEIIMIHIPLEFIILLPVLLFCIFFKIKDYYEDWKTKKYWEKKDKERAEKHARIKRLGGYYDAMRDMIYFRDRFHGIIGVKMDRFD